MLFRRPAKPRPRKREALSAQQTETGGGLTPMLYLERWGNMTNKLTPSRLASILQAADDGDITEQHVLFADMEDRCEHLAAEIGKRKRALLTLDWEILPGRAKDKRAEEVAAAVREQFDMLPTTSDLLLDLADGIGHGFAALEIEWTQTGGLHIPAAFHHRPQSWFQVMRENRNVLRLRDGSYEGAELWPFGWVIHTHRSKSGWLPRVGLFRTVAWAYLIRAYALESAILYTQIHGIPFRLGKYPPGSREEDKAALKTALANLGRDASGIIPQGMEILFEDAPSATQDIPGILVTRCEQGMSKAILGGTLTTQADGKTSTNALGEVHNEVRHDILTSDAAQIAATITRQILAPLAYLNCGVSDPALLPYFRFDTRQAEEGEKVLSVKETSVPQPPAPLTAQARADGDKTDPFPDQTMIDDMAPDADLSAACAELLAPLFDEIREGVEPAELLVRLGDLYPKMNTAKLQELMARAIMLATIIGEASAREEADANA